MNTSVSIASATVVQVLVADLERPGSVARTLVAHPDIIQELAVANANVKKFVEGQAIKKIVVVPGRLINLVV